MGNDLSILGNESIDSFQWSSLTSRDLYLEVSSPACSIPKELCKKVVQNSSKSQIVPKLLQKIIESWQNDFLCTNLLHILKHFILFVYSEKIPYSFLFEDIKKPGETLYESSFHRLVPVSFQFGSIIKTVYISVPQSSDFDRKREQDHMIETIRSHMPEVNEHLLRNNEKIYLNDEQDRVITIDEVFKHYTPASNDTLVDPFKSQTKHFSVLKVIIKTMECDLASPMSQFIQELIEKWLADTNINLVKLHAVLELLLALLASQLFWLDKPIGRIEYKLFKHSPALDILMNLPLETGQMCARVLLEITSAKWKEKKKVSLIESMLSSYLDLRTAEISVKVPQLAGFLLLLLNGYGKKINPFRVKAWEMKWEPVVKFLFRRLDHVVGLGLFTEILKRNPGFINHILSLSEPEVFLEPMLGELYREVQINERTYLILVNLLILSKDKIFIKFINKDIMLSNVSWLKEFHIEKISLGSLMFLALTRVLRENLRNQKLDYIHVIASACLFNISTSTVQLNELPSMEFISLCKALYSRYCKISSKDTSETGIFADLIHLIIEILARILHNGLSLNPSLMQAVLHHSDLFVKLKNSSINNKNIQALHDLIEVFMKVVDTENVIESISIQCKTHSLAAYHAEILNVKEFVFEESLDKWEEFFVPHVWIAVTKEVFLVPNMSRVVLFRHS